MGSGGGMIDFADILQLITWGILVPRSYTVTPGVVDLYYELQDSAGVVE